MVYVDLLTSYDDLEVAEECQLKKNSHNLESESYILIDVKFLGLQVLGDNISSDWRELFQGSEEGSQVTEVLQQRAKVV